MDVARHDREQKVTRTGLGILTLATAFLIGYAVYNSLAIRQVHPPVLPGTAAVSPTACIDPNSNPKEPYGQPPSLKHFPFPLGGWGGFVLLICAVAFTAGGYWGRLRSGGHAELQIPPQNEDAEATGSPGQRKGLELGLPNQALQFALFGLLFFVAFALAFEAYAVTHGDEGQFWPITLYVRCANDLAPIPTLIGATIVSLLLGQWLAYRPKLKAAP